MQIKVISKTELSPWFERWLLEMEPAKQRLFGFLLESLEGLGNHRNVSKGGSLLQVDVSKDYLAELQALTDCLKAESEQR